MHQMWIDIGAKDKKEALSRVTIGDAAVYDHGFEKLHGPLAVSRAFDDKTVPTQLTKPFFDLPRVENLPAKWLQYQHLRKKLEQGVQSLLPTWPILMLLSQWM